MRSTVLALALLVATSLAVARDTPAHAEGPVVMSVQQLIDGDHRVQVPAGAEIVWGDPHFGRVWLTPRPGAPTVERTAAGFRAVFSTPGTYRGAFTIVGGHRSDDIYPMVITVTER